MALSAEIIFCTGKNLDKVKEGLPALAKSWIENHKFDAQPETILCIPNDLGQIVQVLWGVSESAWQMASLACKLPSGTYHVKDWGKIDPQLGYLTWSLAPYQFTSYKKGAEKTWPQLAIPDDVDSLWVESAHESIVMIRDLINTPAADLTPQALADFAKNLAVTHEAKLTLVEGNDLEKEYPAVYTVGKAAAAQPLLIDLTWCHPKARKKLVLVGKGVCFDSGGLDIKPSSGMLIMKKDMGGAAHVLGLASMIMRLNLVIDLRVLIPAVENAISGNAMRPMDVIRTRKGTTVEVGNTDAEGRLILADALFEATKSKPDLILDFATLTGAARVALGTELPALFCNRDDIAQGILSSGAKWEDPLWRMPLHAPYKKYLKSGVADFNNIGKSPYGGAITAALFLEHFVGTDFPWAHIDLMAWNLSSTPGRPEGGEAMGLLAVFNYLTDWLN